MSSVFMLVFVDYSFFNEHAYLTTFLNGGSSIPVFSNAALPFMPATGMLARH
jgi:hypothetical protein